MKFKRIGYIILLFVCFSILGKVDAICYNKCEGSNCYYVNACDSGGIISCTMVSDSYCNPEYNNYDGNNLKTCGSGYIKDIPALVPKIISIVYTVIQIVVPIVLVIFGIIDLIKSITAQKEDEIKKGRNIFIKRLIYAAIVFFVFAVVKFVISIVADSSSNAILECAECFIENKCD